MKTSKPVTATVLFLMSAAVMAGSSHKRYQHDSGKRVKLRIQFEPVI